MNYLITRGRVRGQVIDVPDGLPELLSDITREVLRCQPTTECLCQFIIDYLTSVIRTREKAHIAKAIIDRALREVDEIIGDLCICDIPEDKGEKLCLAMEDCFKRFLEKQRCERGRERDVIKFYDDDMLDELIRRCRFSDEELKISRPVIEDAYNRFVQAYLNASKSADGSDLLYQYFMAREIKRREELKREKAAIAIQATYRGYRVRKQIKEELLLLQRQKEREEQEAAAKIIQRFYRRKFGRPDYEPEEMEMESSIICTPSSEVSLGTKFATVPVTPPELKEGEEEQLEDKEKTEPEEEKPESEIMPSRIGEVKDEFEENKAQFQQELQAQAPEPIEENENVNDAQPVEVIEEPPAAEVAAGEPPAAQEEAPAAPDAPAPE
ncbi:uncharacterized protein LOC119683188 [Teleopsis dalmanni]|uniref:uncharacterized protein LOC119664500 n=1 Tax=Teleopsis dalmanni TaxID=139649 RepID=UPI0018CC82C0|nr:uncharacterized protein LOC119664500 [Teleopsis dalmanni]XP_037948086.1 uncharacterized protein LOC119679672 [Teleopsis dalmanni]XP_037950503.1 uncharacterized protein LOC119681398 [Teleopsis dalmanni]XP_037952734.1 uncharacterized protein LOC119683188 [Teleopsis dalmanni]